MKRYETIMLLFASVLAFLSFVWWQQDDFYIHLQYAKHLMRIGEWSFNQGVPAYGTTSPLWVMVLAIVGLTGLKLEIVAKVLSIAFAVLAVCVIGRHGSVFKHKAFGLLCAVSIMVNHWFRLAAGSGMEATLAALLALILGLHVIQEPQPKAPHIIYEGILSGLLVLARPEWFILPFFFLFSSRMPWKRVPLYGLALLAIVLPWLMYSWTILGTLLPNTVLIKSILVARGEGFLKGVEVSAVRLLFFYGSANGVELVGLVLLLASMLSRHFNPSGVSSAVPRGGEISRDIPLEAWGLVAAIPVVYFVNQLRGGDSISYRYGAPGLPMLIVLGWLGLESSYERITSEASKKWLFPGIVTLMCISNLMLSVLHFPSLQRSLYYMEGVLAEYGRWLKVNAKPGDVVACYDVGAIAYYSDLPVLDLIGLNSVEIIRFHSKHPPDQVMSAAIKVFKPDYLVTRMPISLDAYASVLPAARTILSRDVPTYRFEPSSVFSQPGCAKVCLLYLQWPGVH